MWLGTEKTSMHLPVKIWLKAPEKWLQFLKIASNMSWTRHEICSIWDGIGIQFNFCGFFLFKPVHEVVTVSPEFLPQLFQNLFNLNWFKVSQFIGIREVCFRTKCRMILSWLPWLSSPPSSWSIWSSSLISLSFLSPMWLKYKYLPPVLWSLCFPGAKIAWTETAEEKFLKVPKFWLKR